MPSHKQYATLEPHRKHVSETAIRKNWKKLPSASHTAARELIISAKEQSRGRKGRAAVDLATEDCVQEVARRLTDRLPRIPFPTGTDENHFDHEANLHRISKIDEQLNSNIHSMNLLRAQIAKEEALLTSEEKEIDYLETNLKLNQATRRQRTTRLHPIARKLEQAEDEVDLLALADEEKKKPDILIDDLFEDEELCPILHQLQNHLDTMQSNIASLNQTHHEVQSASIDVERFAFSTLRSDDFKKVAGLLLVDQK